MFFALVVRAGVVWSCAVAFGPSPALEPFPSNSGHRRQPARSLLSVPVGLRGLSFLAAASRLRLLFGDWLVCLFLAEVHGESHG